MLAISELVEISPVTFEACEHARSHTSTFGYAGFSKVCDDCGADLTPKEWLFSGDSKPRDTHYTAPCQATTLVAPKVAMVTQFKLRRMEATRQIRDCNSFKTNTMLEAPPWSEKVGNRLGKAPRNGQRKSV